MGYAAYVLPLSVVLCLLILINNIHGIEDEEENSVLWECDFENNCSNHLRNESDPGKFSWWLWKGPTPSSSYKTGPSGDHTTTNGYYVYTEASLGKTGDMAILSTEPLLADSGLYCIELWYHMFGDHIGKFSVFVISDNTTNFILVQNGNYDNRWVLLKKTVEIRKGAYFSIYFHASRGIWITGDIGMDDITISRGRCIGLWKAWSDWSVCTRSCGGGVQNRSRECDTESCIGNPTEIATCNTHECPDETLVWGCDFQRTCKDFTKASTGNYEWKRYSTIFTTDTLPDDKNKSDNYIFTEAKKGQPGEKATITTSFSHLSTSLYYCLRLKYKIYGPDVGKLEIIYISRTNPDDVYKLFSNTGSGTSEWVELQLDIRTNIGDTFDLGIEATRGSGSSGNIALDDIKVNEGPCTNNTKAWWTLWNNWEACSKTCGRGIQYRKRKCLLEEGCEENDNEGRRCNNQDCEEENLTIWSCNFETECDISKTVSRAQFTWLKRNGSTPSFQTGPTQDHTTGKGYYMYTEATRGVTGDITQLYSSWLNVSRVGHVCFSMWYHMRGKHMGTLLVVAESGFRREALLFKSGNQNKQWLYHESEFGVFSRTQFRVLLLVRRSNGWSGDIAVDDLIITRGRCIKRYPGWSAWSRCGATCGWGSRIRTCKPGVCDRNQKLEKEKCYLKPCPITRNWCGRPGLLPYLIIGGSESDEGRWPWHAAVLGQELSGRFSAFCAASILTDRYLITAAHCLTYMEDGANASEIMISVGSVDKLDGTRYKVKRLLPYPEFDFPSALNDIAIIEVQEAIRFTRLVQPVCLPTHPPRTGRKCHVIGWGKTSDFRFSQGSRFLKEVEQEIQSNEWCLRQYEGYEGTTFQPLSHFCAGPNITNDVSALGDSGGSFSCREEGGYYIQGVVSLGSAEQKRPSVYTDVYKFNDWIRNIINAG